MLYNRLGMSEVALKQLEQALATAQAGGHRATESGLRGSLGNVLRETGDFEAAIKQLEQAVQIAVELGDERGRGNWLSNLGLTHDDLDQTDIAIDYHTQSVEVARKLQDKRGLAGRLGNLGSTLMEAGQILQALDHLSEAAALYRELGDTVTLVLWLNVLGNIYAELGQVATGESRQRSYYVQSLGHYREALKLTQTHNDPITEAALRRRMGAAYSALGRTAEALSSYNGAIRLYEQEEMTDLLPEVEQEIQQARHKKN